MFVKRLMVAMHVVLVLSLSFPSAIYSSSELEDAKRLIIQKSLSLYEIDQELQRLHAYEITLNEQLAESEQKMEAQNRQIEQTRDHAGRTLRAYYMGERDVIWSVFLSAGSFSDVLTLLDYIRMILDNDFRSLRNYVAAQQELQAAHAQLLDIQQQLRDTKASLITQKERANKLERERETLLAKQSAAEQLRQESQHVVDHWASTGLPLFQSYLRDLSAAMYSLPQVLLEDSSHYLTLNGLTATFQMTDRELNNFLHQANPSLRKLSFTFLDQQMLVKGNDQEVELAMLGHFTLEKKNEKTVVLFLVDELSYNGYLLPDTTAKALEKDFWLGFDPESLAAYLEATDLVIEKGRLTLQLKLKLLSLFG